MEAQFAYNINGTGESGIIYIDGNTPKTLCLCTKEGSKIILEAFKKAKKFDKLNESRGLMDAIHDIAEILPEEIEVKYETVTGE